MYGRKIMHILEIAEPDEEHGVMPQNVALRSRPNALGALDRWSSWDVPSLTLPKAKKSASGLRISTNTQYTTSLSQVRNIWLAFWDMCLTSGILVNPGVWLHKFSTDSTSVS